MDAGLIGPGEIVLRLGAATAAGMVIGLNRDLSGKPMGMRTLGLVALGAAAVTVAAITFTPSLLEPDPLSRVVQGILQGVLTGVGFVGAGVVLRRPERKAVHGLTTAAAVWVTAAIGIACGFGGWVVAGATTVIALVLLVLVKWLEGLSGSSE